MRLGKLPLRCGENYIPRGSSSWPSIAEQQSAARILPSTCRTKDALVVLHYARESRHHHHAAEFSRPTVHIQRSPL